MTRDEFCTLPASVALGILWDVAKLGDRLGNRDAPRAPMSPKFDAPIYRSNGIQWASETDVEGLRFWHQRYLKDAESGGEYAAKDAKKAKAIGFWIEWRAAYPSAIWTGERFREVVTAKPPSNKPAVYARDDRPATKPATTAPRFEDNDDALDGEFDDSDIPF